MSGNIQSCSPKVIKVVQILFLNKLSILIVSKSKALEKSFAAMSLPEDCVLDVHTCGKFPENHGSFSPDSVVIFDMTGKAFDIGSIFDDNKPSVVIAAVMADNVPPEAKPANNIWVMTGTKADKGLTEVYCRCLIDFMNSRADSRRLITCFETAIDSIPDLVWFKDVKGSHLKVNDGFCKAVEKTKEQIYKKGHYYIWDIPKEEYEQGDYVCLESEEIVMDARKTILFDEKVKTKSGMRQFKTYKSPLIDADGEIFGTCGIAHDVTDLGNINSELEVILESIPYGVVIENANDKVLSANKEFRKYFPGKIAGINFEDWKSKTLSDSYDISVDVNGQNKILIFSEQPIIDIFGEQIGKLNFFRDVTIERIYEQTTLKSANTDFLTGLQNRRSLFGYLRNVCKKQQLSLITVDLDNFKKVNDSFGHQKGDEALVIAADILQKQFPDDYIARLGGDEFLVVITGKRTEDDLMKAGDRLLAAFREEYSSKEEFSVITASAGIAYAVIKRGSSHDVERLLHNSDSALYDAKYAGKAKCRMFKAENVSEG
ncbi:MAG: diguanylate cyclase [Oscillospiraceae bacterium]|nr:diguanylate cyclase [Oscillospiraceae bacterium]